MKTLTFILFLFPAFCFAQEEKGKTNTPVKPSTTDCPTWNKKDKKADKTAYFKSLRSNKTSVNQQIVSKPTNYRDSKIQSNSVQQKTESSDQKINVIQTQENRNTEEVTVLQTKTEKRPAIASSKDDTPNIASEDNKTSSKDELRTQNPNIASEDNKTSSKDELRTQNAVKNDITPSSSEVQKAAVNDSADQKTTVQKTEKQEKDKTESSKIKKKLERMSRKTTRVGKHSNAKCPSF